MRCDHYSEVFLYPDGTPGLRLRRRRVAVARDWLVVATVMVLALLAAHVALLTHVGVLSWP